MNCYFKSTSCPNPKDLFLGLSVDNFRQLQLNSAVFSCCGSSGFRKNSECEDKTQYILCPLVKKFQSTKELFNLYLKFYPSTKNLPQLHFTQFQKYWQWFVLFKHKRIFCGPIISEKHSDEILWASAMMGTWWFSFEIFVMKLGEGFIPALFKKLEEPTPLIVFVDQVDELWVSEKNEEFSLIINICEKGLIPLWIKLSSKQPFQSKDPKESKNTFSVTEQIQKLLKAKNRTPFSYLSPIDYSKLKTISIFPSETKK